MDYKKPFAHDHEPIKDLLTAIKVAVYLISWLSSILQMEKLLKNVKDSQNSRAILGTPSAVISYAYENL